MSISPSQARINRAAFASAAVLHAMAVRQFPASHVPEDVEETMRRVDERMREIFATTPSNLNRNEGTGA